MSFSAPARMRLWLLEIGAAWILIPAVIEIILLAWLGGLRDRGCFDFTRNEQLLAFTMSIVMFMWTPAVQYQSRLLLSASELRVPRVSRMLCLTLGGFAAWTFFALLAPIVVLHGPYLQWLLFVFYALCAGVLVALLGGTYLGTPVSVVCMVVGVDATLGSSTVSARWVEILTVAMPFLIAWRLRVLIRALRSGAHRDLLLRSLAEVEGWWKQPARWSTRSPATAGPGACQVLTAWQRVVFGEKTRLRQPAVDRSSTGVWHISLGPLYGRRVSWILLCFAPLPIIVLPATHARTVAFATQMTGPVLMILAVLCGPLGVMFILARVRRLADLLYNPSGEIADLALLPGWGGRWLQRRALLREALVRPLLYYGLCLGGMAGSCWVLVRLGQAHIEPILSLVLPPAALLAMFAMMTAGVLSGRLGRDSPWFGRSMFLMLPFMYLTMFAALDPVSPRDWLPTLLMWQSIAWAIVLGTMTIFLVRWVIQLSRRPDFPYRSV